MNDKDRIRLAEAMGWDVGWIGGWQSKEAGYPADIWSPPGRHDHSGYCWHSVNELPHPFTDANDDYAVLEWMRAGLTGARNDNREKARHWVNFVLLLSDWQISEYQIGDYARAALKVLDGD